MWALAYVHDTVTLTLARHIAVEDSANRPTPYSYMSQINSLTVTLSANPIQTHNCADDPN